VTRIERLLGALEGDEVERCVDLIVSDDWTTPALTAPLAALGTERAAAPLVVVHDHTHPRNARDAADRARVAQLSQQLEAFAARFAARLISGAGIQHHVLHEHDLLRPGMLVLANDSHAPTLGADGVLALAAQPTTIAAALHTGTVVLRVPRTLRVALTGQLGPGVSARDAALTLRTLLNRPIGTQRLRATGCAIEFVGPAIASLSRDERSLLANCAPEVAALTATFPTPDEPAWDPERAPADLTLDLSHVRASVAPAASGDTPAPLAELPRRRIDRVFVGTCSGGTIEELRAFERALSQALQECGAERVAVPTLVAPVSRTVEAQLAAEGVLERLEGYGVERLAPGCGPCFGFGRGRLAAGEVAAVTGNRNARGRYGAADSHAHLVAGAAAGTAAASGWLGEAAPATTTIVSGEGDTTAVRIAWPRHGNAIRIRGTLTTDDITPSLVPGIGASSDTDPAVLRRLLFAHLDRSASERDLRGHIVVADHDFGRGSNRASAVRALRYAGVAAVVARSVAPLYAAGARDEGLSVVELDDDAFYAAVHRDAQVHVDLASGRVSVDGTHFTVRPAGPFERAVHAAGGIVPYLRGRPERARDSVRTTFTEARLSCHHARQPRDGRSTT